MSSDVIRYGIIGSGMMGFEHIRNIALLPTQSSQPSPTPTSRRAGSP